jgi:hypothetical protein
MQEIQETQQESIISDSENNNIPLTKKKRTINAPRSEKQIEAFKKAQEKRDENRRIVKEQKEIKLAKLYMENKLKEQQQSEPKETKVTKLLKKEKKQIIKYVESDSESEDEIVYVKKPKKKIKKQKKIVYESSDDDDDEPPMLEKKPVLKRESNRVIRTKKDNDNIIDFHSFFI